MDEFPDFSLHIFDDSDFRMESSARFPEIDATDLLEMRENNQNKNTQRSTKKNGLKCLTYGVLSEAKWESLRSFPNKSLTTFFGCSAYGLVQFLAVLRIFLIQLFPNWTACSSITYTKQVNYSKIKA